MNWHREILKDVGALTDAQMTLDLRIKSLEMDILHLLGNDVDTPIHSMIVDEMESIRHRIHLMLVSILMTATNVDEPLENDKGEPDLKRDYPSGLNIRLCGKESDLEGITAREAVG